MRDKAVAYYTQHKKNCAQSVALAWCESRKCDAAIVESFAGYGHGKAPEGLCGAIYAACHLAGPADEHRIKQGFREITEGRLTCREIRKSRILSCVECVSQAASLLDTARGNRN